MQLHVHECHRDKVVSLWVFWVTLCFFWFYVQLRDNGLLQVDASASHCQACTSRTPSFEKCACICTYLCIGVRAGMPGQSGEILCGGAKYFWALSMELALSHPSGAYVLNFICIWNIPVGATFIMQVDVSNHTEYSLWPSVVWLLISNPSIGHRQVIYTRTELGLVEFCGKILLWSHALKVERIVMNFEANFTCRSKL